MSVKHARSSSAPPPPIRITPRDRHLIHTVYTHRVLRRDQIERLYFPSKNTANLRLQRLHQHGYLARRRLPVEYGQGSSQWLYLLGSRGANLVALAEGIGLEQLAWRRSHNHVSAMFLEHTLMVNDIRIAMQMSSQRAGYRVERWLREEELKARPDRVWIESAPRRRRQVALVPDAFCALTHGNRRSHFLVEADRATESNGRWRQKVLAYLAYVRSGAYERRFHTNCLRVLVVTTSEARLRNILRTTQKAGGAKLFWFTTLDDIVGQDVESDAILRSPIWRRPGEKWRSTLVKPSSVSERSPCPAPMLLYCA